MVTLKNQAEIDRMREAGRVVGVTLRRVAETAKAGVSLAELEAVGAACIAEHGALSNFLNYLPRSADRPFPATLCLSVNDVVVHGVPDERVLKTGDILSIDGGAIVDGWHGDAAVTVPIGEVDSEAVRLIDTNRAALAAGIAQARPGGRIGDISHAIETLARSAGYGLLRGCGGHGIGRAMHEDPSVPNTGKAGRGYRLRPGLVIAIEPMLIESGLDQGRLLSDGWSIATQDGSRAAHFEHTVAVTEDGPVVLTLP